MFFEYFLHHSLLFLCKCFVPDSFIEVCLFLSVNIKPTKLSFRKFPVTQWERDFSGDLSDLANLITTFEQKFTKPQRKYVCNK